MVKHGSGQREETKLELMPKVVSAWEAPSMLACLGFANPNSMAMWETMPRLAWFCPPLPSPASPRFPPSVQLCSFSFLLLLFRPALCSQSPRTFSLSNISLVASRLRNSLLPWPLFSGTIFVISRDFWTCRRICVPSRICLSSAILGCHRCISTCKCTSWYSYFFWIDFLLFSTLGMCPVLGFWDRCEFLPALYFPRCTSEVVFFVLKFWGWVELSWGAVSSG